MVDWKTIFVCIQRVKRTQASSLEMSMSQYWSDLEQTEYDPEEFVERLAYRWGHLTTLIIN